MFVDAQQNAGLLSWLGGNLNRGARHVKHSPSTRTPRSQQGPVKSTSNIAKGRPAALNDAGRAREGGRVSLSLEDASERTESRSRATPTAALVCPVASAARPLSRSEAKPSRYESVTTLDIPVTACSTSSMNRTNILIHAADEGFEHFFWDTHQHWVRYDGIVHVHVGYDITITMSGENFREFQASIAAVTL